MANYPNGLVKIEQGKLVHTGSSVHWRVPKVIKQKHGMTIENRKSFVVHYFQESGSNDVIIRVEKIDDEKRQDDGTK